MDITVQRLDKWLWFTRLVKTRSQASKLVSAGKVRINRVKVTKPASSVKQDDIITAVIHQNVRIVKVLKPGQRRGPAPEAQELYEDLKPKEQEESLARRVSGHKPKEEKAVPIVHVDHPKRDKGAGRPTKRERRKMSAFRNRSS